MKIIARHSTNIDLISILADLCNDLPPEKWDAGFFFISYFSPESGTQIAAEVRKRVPCAVFLGCSCAGVITADSEIENQPAVSLVLMKFENVTVRPFYMTQNDLAAMDSKDAWYKFFDVYPNEKPKFFILPDPFSIDINHLLNSFNNAYELCPMIGGMASGGMQAGENILILNNQIYEEGCVGLSLQGNIRIETVVSQGCRPIGDPYIVTKAQGNVIHDLGGQTFYKVLEEVLNLRSTERDRILAQDAIFVGIAMDESKHELRPGDFLIRLVIGLDQQNGAGAVADYVKPGQTIQFHVRDAISATQELTDLLRTQVKRHPRDIPVGALVFSCNGRGKNLFNVPDHDLNLIKKHVGELPLAGFFCAGEIGPVGGKNFAHGFTSSIALFYPPGLPA